MLFNSYIFIFAFLPVVLAVFYALKGHDPRYRIYWLVLASFFFYGWWSPPYVLLLALFVIANFAFGRLIEKTGTKFWLVIGIGFNLSLILYYKYFYFLLSQVLPAPTIEELFPWASPLLPLAISFFTFQQIAYLVDAYQGQAREYRFTHYALFVTFFPQLIAGPIVHHRDMLPQFMQPGALTP
jgi:alginate O-acetyltransferase complex protein AlgI